MASAEVYMHRGGFCRFSMTRYSADNDLNDLGSHLTNVAVLGLDVKMRRAKSLESQGMAGMRNNINGYGARDVFMPELPKFCGN